MKTANGIFKYREKAIEPTFITAGLGGSRRADAPSEEHQAYLPSSVAQVYRIDPERDSQAG